MTADLLRTLFPTPLEQPLDQRFPWPVEDRIRIVNTGGQEVIAWPAC